MQPARWPPIEPFATESLEVGEGHVLYLEQCGLREGRPMLVLHGGPGAGFTSAQRRLFDPARYRTILFDQRGCARSRPRGETRANDTWRLVADIERIRAHLGIERWIVYGGSWGSSLALVWAAGHRQACEALILRAAFLAGDDDLDWFFGGVGTLLPDAWMRLVARINLDLDPARVGSGLRILARLAAAMLDEPAPAGLTPGSAATAWADWEAAVSRPGMTPVAGTPVGSLSGNSGGANQSLVDYYRIQAHYLRHRCFFGDSALLDAARRLDGVPTHIIHGRLDWICRPVNALRVSTALPGSRLHWADQAAHSQFDQAMLGALDDAVRAIEERAGT